MRGVDRRQLSARVEVAADRCRRSRADRNQHHAVLPGGPAACAILRSKIWLGSYNYYAPRQYGYYGLRYYGGYGPRYYGGGPGITFSFGSGGYRGW